MADLAIVLLALGLFVAGSPELAAVTVLIAGLAKVAA